MPNKFEETFTNIADAIREKTDSTDKIKPEDMASKISAISSGGNLQDYFNLVTGHGGYFKNCSKMTTEELTKLLNGVSTSKITNFKEMFYGCSSLTTIPFIDTSHIQQLSGTNNNSSYMFYNCFSLTSIPNLDMKNSTYTGYMFYNCSSLITMPITDFSHSSSTTYMFNKCSKLENISLNIPQSTSLEYMFAECTSIKSINLTLSSTITSLEAMFANCQNLEELTLTNLKTANLKTCSNIFHHCYKLKNIPYFDTSNTTVAYGMFNSCEALTSIPAYDFSNCTYVPEGSGGLSPFSNTFYNCFNLEEIHCTNFKRGFDITASTKFTEEALVEIINNLYDIKTSESRTEVLKIGATNLAKLTDEEKQIATTKGWSLA